MRERAEEMSEKKKNVKKRISLTKNNTTKTETSATSNDSNKDVETETETQMSSTMAASERSSKVGTYKRTRDECDSKRQKPKEGSRGTETDKSPKRPENKRLDRIPRKSPEDQETSLQLQTSKEDKEFFRERREDAQKKGGSRREEASRRLESPIIALCFRVEILHPTCKRSRKK